MALSEGDEIQLVDRSGTTIKGRFTSMSANSLALVVDGRLQELPEVTIRAIRKRQPDKWWNGALIGAGIGGGTGAAVALAMCSGDVECPAKAERFFIGLAATAAGTGIAAWIDLFISRFDAVYERPETVVQFDLLPILSSERKGIRFSMSF